MTIIDNYQNKDTVTLAKEAVPINLNGLVKYLTDFVNIEKSATFQEALQQDPKSARYRSATGILKKILLFQSLLSALKNVTIDNSSWDDNEKLHMLTGEYREIGQAGKKDHKKDTSSCVTAGKSFNKALDEAMKRPMRTAVENIREDQGDRLLEFYCRIDKSSVEDLRWPRQTLGTSVFKEMFKSFVTNVTFKEGQMLEHMLENALGGLKDETIQNASNVVFIFRKILRSTEKASTTLKESDESLSRDLSDVAFTKDPLKIPTLKAKKTKLIAMVKKLYENLKPIYKTGVDGLALLEEMIQIDNPENKGFRIGNIRQNMKGPYAYQTNLIQMVLKFQYVFQDANAIIKTIENTLQNSTIDLEISPEEWNVLNNIRVELAHYCVSANLITAIKQSKTTKEEFIAHANEHGHNNFFSEVNQTWPALDFFENVDEKTLTLALKKEREFGLAGELKSDQEAEAVIVAEAIAEASTSAGKKQVPLPSFVTEEDNDTTNHGNALGGQARETGLGSKKIKQKKPYRQRTFTSPGILQSQPWPCPQEKTTGRESGDERNRETNPSAVVEVPIRRAK